VFWMYILLWRLLPSEFGKQMQTLRRNPLSPYSRLNTHSYANGGEKCPAATLILIYQTIRNQISEDSEHHLVYCCKFFILLFNSVSHVFLFMYSYWQVYSVLYIPCQLAFSGYPDWGFSVLFSVVRQKPRYNSQRRGKVRTLPN
jgi:hypothetical protein